MARLLTAFHDEFFEVLAPELSDRAVSALNRGTITTLSLAQSLHPNFAKLAGHADSELAKCNRRIMVALWNPEGVAMLVFPAHLDRPSDAQLARVFGRLLSAPQPAPDQLCCAWEEE